MDVKKDFIWRRFYGRHTTSWTAGFSGRLNNWNLVDICHKDLFLLFLYNQTGGFLLPAARRLPGDGHPPYPPTAAGIEAGLRSRVAGGAMDQTAGGRRYVRLATLTGGLFTIALGGWAFFAPWSFFVRLATFEPYNRHLIHDIGAFQLGIGVSLLVVLRWSDALATVLAGAAVGAGFHWVSHVLDRGLGGRPRDLWVLGAFALILFAALGLHLRHRRPDRTGPAGP
jgi:hypothetical protein